jgi:hypothetical protein
LVTTAGREARRVMSPGPAQAIRWTQKGQGVVVLAVPTPSIGLSSVAGRIDDRAAGSDLQ